MLRPVPLFGLAWIALLPLTTACATVVEPGNAPDGGMLSLGGSPSYGTGGTPTFPSTGGSFGTGGIAAGTGGLTAGSGGSLGTGGTSATGGVTATGGGTGCFLGICATGGAQSSGGASSGGSTSVGGGTSLSCDNAICWDIFDCFIFHPDLGACGFTKCENFVCKK